MFSTLKTKTVFFIVLLMATTAGVIMYFTHREVGRAILESEESSVQNILRLVELNIQGGYEKLLTEKFDMILNVKKQLKGISELCKSILEEFVEISKDSISSEHEAQKRSLHWIRSVRLKKGNLFAFDRKGEIVAHPDSGLIGTSIGFLRDVKGRRIAEVMRPDAIKGEGDFAVFSWKDSSSNSLRNKLGYFFPIRKWQWTICAMIENVDVEAEARKKIKILIKVLKNTLKNIQIAKTGVVFLFNGQGEILIPPPGNQKEDYGSVVNLKTGNLLLSDLKKAVISNKNSVHYIEPTSFGDQVIEAHVRYFKSFDWYIVISVPFREIHEPAKTLVARQSFIIATIFFGSLIVAYILMAKISRPLEKLASYAQKIPLQDFTAKEPSETALIDLPIKSNDEVGRLAESFKVMETKLKENIQEVLTAQAKYKTILESIEDGFFETDLRGRLTFFNSSICKMTGYTREQLLGKNRRDLIASESFDEVDLKIKRVFRTGKPTQIRGFELVKKDGTKCHFELSIYLVNDESGQPTGFRGVLRDISERLKADKEKKKLETQLQRAQKMEAIGMLAGGVAHDLNNVLSGLVSYPELLLVDIPKDSTLRKPILTMQKSGERASAIVQDLLTLARRGISVTDVVDLNKIIKEYLSSPECKKLLSYHPQVQMMTNLETDRLNILGSPIHLSKTIMNLVSNAAEAMTDGGTISISTENRYIDKPIRGYDDVEKGDYVCLMVSDTGIGISSDDLERIFEPFYTKKVMGRSGTGLGMAVVWGTVKDHFGYIDVQSTIGKGTSFTLYFPVTRKDINKEKTRISFDEFLGNGEKILVVDDMEDQREIASQILTRLGYCVSSVSSGEEAVDYLNANSVDLLVLDMIMDPGIDGLETYKRILNIHPGQKAIIASGFSETGRVRETQRLGAGEYIKKPYALEKMGIAVKIEIEKE